MLPFFSLLWSYDIHVHQRVVSLEVSGEVHHAGSFLTSYIFNALFMYCCSMPPMRYSATAGRGRPASTRELTSVDLVIHVAMAAATRILVEHDRDMGPDGVKFARRRWRGSDWSVTVTKLAHKATVGPARDRDSCPP